MYIQIEKTSRAIKHCYPSIDKNFINYSWCGEFECEQDFYISRKRIGVVVAIYTISGCGEAIVNGEKAALDAERFGDCRKVYALVAAAKAS